MKKLLWLLLLLLMTATVQAAPIQQNTAPSIETFTASLRAVDRSALQNRRVRIPVSWSTVNRPLTSNLYFEQVFADGSTINVELPRLFPWVSSSGDGVVAPIMPFNAVSEITLRLRMVDFFSQEVYSERQITLPIANTGDPGADFGFVPTLTRFSIQSPTILRSQLSGGAARIGVSWQAINRPLTATLVFEQIMPDGSVINVELPRSTPWVNSAGDGVVAPHDPGSSVDQVRLRVRLLDGLNGRIYDQRYAFVNIFTPQPATI